jgi:UDP-glucose 4-epimerase
MMDSNDIVRSFGGKYKRALVTGGAGFIGSHIIEELLKMNIEVISVDNFSAGREKNIRDFINNSLFTSYNVDITDYEKLKACFTGVDIVFNQAASKKNICLHDPRRDLDVNAKGTYNLLCLARDYGVKKFVHASTGSVYGEAQIHPQTEEHPLEPVSYYGVSKLAGERYVKVFEKLYGLDVTILRYFHVYGPRQDSSEFGGVVSIFIRNLLSKENPAIFGDGTQERSFTYVKDVVRANLLVASLEDKTKGEVYNCASGIKVTINELCNAVIEKLDNSKSIKPVYKDWTIGDIKIFDISNKKICNLGLSFEKNVNKGIEKTIDWFLSQNNDGDI